MLKCQQILWWKTILRHMQTSEISDGWLMKERLLDNLRHETHHILPALRAGSAFNMNSIMSEPQFNDLTI